MHLFYIRPGFDQKNLSNLYLSGKIYGSMNRRKYLLFIILIMVSVLQGFAQNILKPNSALKSHKTLEITSIELSPDKTVFNLVIENQRSEGGSFCADRNIFILYPDGSRLRLLKATDIPVCPDTYKFSSIGEKLHFTLTFPPLKPGTEWIDLLEDCSDNCFWFYGLTLNEELNHRLDEAFQMASSGDPEENVLLFKKILDDIDSRNLGIEGALYVNIINASLEAGDKIGASVWYKRLLKSGAPRMTSYVHYLNEKGIKY